MKRFVAVLCMSIFVFGISSVAFAQPYRNRSFPPPVLLIEAQKSLKRGCGQIHIVGKRSLKNNAYEIYFRMPKHKNRLIRANVMKLDNDTWIFRYSNDQCIVK